MKKYELSSLELLKEIEAFLSFNNNPSRENLKNIKNDIKKHIELNVRKTEND